MVIFVRDVQELTQISPQLAIYYSFHTATSVPNDLDGSGSVLGAEAAYEELHKRGCVLATKSWVDNHWCLILWKLAGMVALDPECENDPSRRRWCWDEVRLGAGEPRLNQV